jgi:hypothetical protein
VRETEKFINCWEHMGCGRETGGAKTKKTGVCPAAEEQILDQVHGGKNAGRSCWAGAGTFASGQMKGTFAKKYKNCELCDFYKRVRDEEGVHFWPPVLLQHILERGP